MVPTINAADLSDKQMESICVMVRVMCDSCEGVRNGTACGRCGGTGAIAGLVPFAQLPVLQQRIEGMMV